MLGVLSCFLVDVRMSQRAQLDSQYEVYICEFGWQIQTEVVDNLYFSVETQSHAPYILCRMALVCQATLIKVIIYLNLSTLATML